MNQRPAITSEDGDDAPVDLVDDDLPKGFVAMFGLDSFYLERTGRFACVIIRVG